ncbi:Zinc carboxypeptidase [Salegentibacter agarivorans]|uniref:Zinc carboxypeptidase n=1 Tax=Salegentibacter agarivorans TaxID=345907 RepID=A0A1I2PZW9_9FLAO|nr:M14 family metallopeptidase [Salegentibacter agarivorans]SFG21624.1 Zinc carboxypeptidase [Salegentibacter agarivorans]
MRNFLFLKKPVFILLSSIFFLGCSGISSVPFETPVDTKDKTIQYQSKKTYEISDLDVYASNKFPGARLNGIEKLNDSTVKVIIHPENKPINPSPYYAFELWSTNSKEIYVAFQYPEKVKHRYRPKIREENNEWRQIDTNQFYRIDSLFTVKVSLDQKPKILAAQELANSKDVKDWYTNLGNMNKYVHIKKYGSSKLGRDLNLLDIYKGEKESKPILVLLTRQHPPEITGYLAYQSFLETILKENEITERFLDEYRVLAFPLLNPDGVDLGHWRHNAGGVDLNRDWSKYNQPEIRKTVKYIDEQVKKYNTTVDLAIDFHSTYEDVFYTNKQRKGTQLPNFIKNWFDALEKEIPEYVVNEAAGNSKKPVSKGWFLKKYNSVGITYEIGDQTSRDRIDEIGRISALEMMKLLTD